MKKVIITFILIILVVILGITFIDEVNPEYINDNKNEVIYSIMDIPKDFKSTGNLDKRVQDIIVATSNGLIELNSNNEIKPNLAESVDINDDGLEYKFKLKDNIYWSDGNKITSKDIAMFFREILTEENEESLGALLNVYGAKSFRDGVGDFSENVGISYDDNSITFRLNSKDDKFLEELTEPQYRLRKNVLLWENLINNYKTLVYSGDYIINKINDDYVKLKKSNNTNNKLVDNIVFIKDDNEEMAMAAFEIYERDVVVNPPKSQLERLSSENRLLTLKSNCALYVGFNLNNSNLDINQRKNIYRIMTKALEEYQLKNISYLELAEGSYFREDKEDLTKLQARKVISMEEEEWKKPDKLQLIIEDNGNNKELSNFLAKWFEEKENIYLSYSLVNKEDINNIDISAYYDMLILEGNLTSTNENSIYNKLNLFTENKIDEQISRTKTEGERILLLRSIEDELFNRYSFLPLAFINENIAINGGIKNIYLDGNGNIIFH